MMESTTSDQQQQPQALAPEHSFLVGVWQRAFEEFPLNSGNFDRTTLVLWIQAPCGLFIDLRIPRAGQEEPFQTSTDSRPNPAALSANGTSRPYDAAVTHLLLQQQSFAGHLHCSTIAAVDTAAETALDRDGILRSLPAPYIRCYWERRVDRQPPAERLDVGICAIQRSLVDGTQTMRETGDDGSYAEEWIRLAGTNHSECGYMAMELVHPSCRRGYWIRTGCWFALALGYPTEGADDDPSTQIFGNPIHKGKSLAEVVKDWAADDQCRMLGSYLALAGRVESTSGAWRVEYCTNPELVGCCVVGGKEDSLCCSSVVKTDDGMLQQTLVAADASRCSETFTWKIRECSSEGVLPISRPPPPAPTYFGMDPHPNFANITMPPDFDLPSFRMTMLGPSCTAEDFDAVKESTDRLVGLFGNEWPKGLVIKENEIDLSWHEREFTLGRSFAWVVRDPESGIYLGCAYIFPSFDLAQAAKLVTWIRSHPPGDTGIEELESLLRKELGEWMAAIAPSVFIE